MGLLPVFTYIAILRYFLFDLDVVDVVINRTLVCGSLTAILIGLYFDGIVVLQRIFVLLTGGQPTLAVVAPALLIAALFVPWRRRIQGFIDRRFYRRKYDARKTLESWGVEGEVLSKVRILLADAGEAATSCLPKPLHCLHR